jgi:3-hydroxyisobutyrate dehydrogenase-like beta-hydroxyacid dehydrogenase
MSGERLSSADGEQRPWPRVGLAGPGLMGRPMALRLLAAGVPLSLWGRRTEAVAPLVERGAEAASDPAELGERSEIVLTVLPAAPEVRSVLLGDGGVLSRLRPGGLVVDCSTIDPASARELAATCAEREVGFVDAPVSGGVRGAEAGTLSVMAGGADADVERARVVLEVLGRVTHVGPSGAGQVAKAANQLIVSVTIEAVAEALVLSAKAGARPERVREALLGGFASSTILDQHGQRMLTGDYEPGGRSRLHLKDVRIISALADEVGASLPAFEVVARAYRRLVEEEGRGELDHSALALSLAEANGLRLGGLRLDGGDAS